jgi:hypothetical protein
MLAGMPAHAEPRSERARFTVAVESVAEHGWHLTVIELPGTWTVAFAREEIEERVRTRIALDTGLDPHAFDIAIEPPERLFLERRATRRPD